MNNDLNIQFSKKFFIPVFYKIINDNKRFVINYGGAGSGKSFSQSQKEIIKLIGGNGDTIVLRKYASDIYDTCYSMIYNNIKKFRLEENGIKFEYAFSGNKREIRCINSGNKMMFKGIDDTEKLKSLTGVKRSWVEEASQISEDEFLELNRRLRGFEDIQFSLTFNPISENHWLKHFFFDTDIPSIKDNTSIIKSTYLDNRFLTEKDIEQIEALKQINYNHYMIYAMGEWGKMDVKNPFAYSFIKEKHVKKNVEIDYSFPVWLSFDFNINPITCIVSQIIDKNTININREYRIVNSDIYQLCERINTDFAGKQAFFKITGDSSGKNGSAMVAGSLNYYKIIRQLLYLNDDRFKLNGANLHIKNSRALLNHVLYNMNVSVSDECKFLIEDLMYASVKDSGEWDKGNDQRNHLLDCLRYLIDNNFGDYMDDAMKFIK